jgi:hypothetical protein
VVVCSGWICTAVRLTVVADGCGREVLIMFAR